MTTLRDQIVLAVLALFTVLATPCAYAQEYEEPDSQVATVLFGETVNVNVVNVEVYVTDKKGNPVTDLTAEDFEIFEDRKPMKITNFSAFADGKPVGAAEPPGVDFTPAPPGRDLLAAEIPEDQRLRLVVFVDNFNLRPLHRKRVMPQLRQFLLNNLGPQDRAMLVSYDRTIHIRQGFTSDPSLINDGLRELDEKMAMGSQHDRERRRLLSQIDESEEGEALLNAIFPYAETVFNDMNATIDAIRDVVAFLAGLPGRKAVLYVSSGFPMVAAADLFTAVEQKYQGISVMSQLASYDASRRFEELGAQANANGVTFHTLDASGLQANASRAAEEEGLDTERIAHHLDSDHRANLQAPVYFLADSTGGRAIVNQNDVQPALDSIAKDFRNFYSLGYTPSHYGDGRYYSIKVTTKRKGTRVQHRAGYRDKSAETRMSEGTLAVLKHGVENNPLGVDLVFGVTSQVGDKRFTVPIQVRIPVGRLTLLPGAEHHVGRIRLYIAALDEDGGMSEVQNTPLSMRIPNAAAEAARSEQWLFSHQLLMGRGHHRVAIGVYDEVGMASSFIVRSVIAGN